MIGCLLPVGLWSGVVGARLPTAFLLRFFAGFCLIANGAYLAAGSFDGIGDCGDLLRRGTPIWLLWLFGGLTIPPGFVLWHRQGEHFGLGPKAKPISPRLAYATATFTVATVVGELVWSAL